MAIRTLKAVLVGFVALMCLMYALQNMVNLDSAYVFVKTMVTREGQVLYPETFGFAIHAPWLIWTILWIIIGSEITAGLVSAKGAWDLWTARTGGEFEQAKTWAIVGAGLALVVWFGYFTVIGGAYLQMWQTEAGANSLQGAFQISISSGLVLLFVNMRDAPL